MSDQKFEFNPLAAKNVAIDRMLDHIEGRATFVSGNDPLELLIESSVLTGVGIVEGMESVLQQIHPKLSKSRQDLYRHMDSEDFRGVFSTPSYLPELNMAIRRVDVERLAVPVPGTTVRKLIIPRFTRIMVSGTSFMLDNDIEIRLLSHGAINILYLDNETPLFTRESNAINWKEITLIDEKYILLPVDLWQLDYTKKIMQLNPTKGLRATHTIPHQFYLLRARYQSGNEWYDMEVTHSEKQYDYAKPTLIVSVMDDRIETSLPSIYYNSGQVTGKVEVTIFFTRGSLTLQLKDFTPSAYNVSYAFNETNPDLARYSAPLNKNLTIQMFSDSLVSSGSDGTSFEVLRDAVIERRLGASLMPITQRQLKHEAAKKGYDVKIDVDNVTNRTFLLSRLIPKPSEMLDMGLINTALGFRDRVNASIARVYETFEGYRKVHGVYDNGHRLTITSNARFKTDGGVVRTLTEQERSEINLLDTQEAKVIYFNRERVLFTPFDYVIDITTPNFSSRAYYLKEPIVYGKEIRGVNDTMEYDSRVESYDIVRTDDGYRLLVGCVLGANILARGLSNLKTQLSINVMNSDIRAYQNMDFIGIDPETDYYMFMADIASSFDIDDNDLLYLDSFRMSSGADTLRQPLDTEISVAFAMSEHNDPNYRPYVNDVYYNGGISDPTAKVFNVESLLVKFGERLEHLYSATDVAMSQAVYATHDTDKPYTFPENQPKRDPNGDIVLEYDSENNSYSIVWEHLKGDVIKNEQGEIQYEYRIGDIKFDENNEKIFLKDRSVLYGVDLYLADYKFQIADDPDVQNYWYQVPKLLRDWINDDIGQFSTRLLENTELYMYPNSNMGKVVVNSDNGRHLYIDAEQSLQVKVYMEAKNHQNETIKENIRNTIKEILAVRIADPIVSRSDITEEIRKVTDDYVLDVSVTGLGGKQNDFDIMTILDSTERLAIKKKLVLRPDGVITIEDDVLIDIVRHDPVQT